MIQQPDQFQNKVYVRLPFSDKYLADDVEAKKTLRELKHYFQNPILVQTITPVKRVNSDSSCIETIKS